MKVGHAIKKDRTTALTYEEEEVSCVVWRHVTSLRSGDEKARRTPGLPHIKHGEKRITRSRATVPS